MQFLTINHWPRCSSRSEEERSRNPVELNRSEKFFHYDDDKLIMISPDLNNF